MRSFRNFSNLCGEDQISQIFKFPEISQRILLNFSENGFRKARKSKKKFCLREVRQKSVLTWSQNKQSDFPYCTFRRNPQSSSPPWRNSAPARMAFASRRPSISFVRSSARLQKAACHRAAQLDTARLEGERDRFFSLPTDKSDRKSCRNMMF